MRAAVAAEWLKVRRSSVTLIITGLLVLVVPTMSFGLFWVAVNGGFGPLAAKSAGLVVGEGWDGYLNAAGQISAVAVFLAVGITTAWMFGREYVDNTFPSLFALPVSRASIALAKTIVAMLWASLTVVAMVLIVGLIGQVTGLESTTGTSVIGGLARLVAIAFLASMLGATSAVAASRWRGYLPAIGWLIIVVAVAQMAVLFGTGGWFPYAVPGLLVVAGADGVPTVTVTQLLLVPAMTGVAVWTTTRLWRNAEAV